MIKTWDNSCLFEHLQLFTRGHTRLELEILNDDKLRKKLNKEQTKALTSLIRKFNSFDKKLDSCIKENTAVIENINFDIL